jgi:uncharacterized protein (DUF58 family)
VSVRDDGTYSHAPRKTLLQGILRRVRRIEIRARRLVDEGFAGEYLSVFKGRGMEFSEVRDYQPGDDVRTIDWNVTARMGHPYIKRYVEERELTVLLAVDVSASELFGTAPQTKAELQAEVSALIAFAAIQNNDRVGLLLFTDRIERYVPPAKGPRHALRIVRELLGCEPVSPRTSISTALQTVGRLLPRRAVIFLVSDFRDEGFEKSLRITARRHDLIAVRVGDPREERLPDCGVVRVVGAESGEDFLLDTSSRTVRESVGRYERERMRRLASLFRAAGVDQICLSTDRSYERPLLRFFRERAERAS